MAKLQEAKHTVIIDADLHIQDPHDIILSYFNTNNDNQFAYGERGAYVRKVMFLFVALVMMKLFFDEMFTGFFMFATTLAISLAVGYAISEGAYFFMKIMQKSARNDGIRGIFFQIVFITLIVVGLGAFI